MAGGVRSPFYPGLGGNVGAVQGGPAVGGYASFAGFWMGGFGSAATIADAISGRVLVGSNMTGRRLDGDNLAGRTA